ncbi:hypothetical protein DYQ86_19425 [Acidobacteria bacterium AB60]|nr:hypothetical protein DYQ86_19425 [Acidobacteria bacterium AB60]
MKNLYKRWLIVGLSMSIFALANLRRKLEAQVEREIGNPATPPAKDGESKPTPVLPITDGRPSYATTVTFSGTVIRSGGRFALLETGGILYMLDSTGRAWPFEGEDVRVTGKLDTTTHLLHVDDIQAMAS